MKSSIDILTLGLLGIPGPDLTDTEMNHLKHPKILKP